MRHAVVALAVACASLAAHGQEGMEFKCPPSGTKLTFDRGYTLTFSVQEGPSCIAHNDRGLKFLMYAHLYPMSPARLRDPSWAKYIEPIRVERLWPLAVGKKHQGTVNLSGDTFNLQYTVAGKEVIQTPLGSEEVFVIKMTEGSTGGYQASSTWWVSTKYNAVIRQEHFSTMFPSFKADVIKVEMPAN